MVIGLESRPPRLSEVLRRRPRASMSVWSMPPADVVRATQAFELAGIGSVPRTETSGSGGIYQPAGSARSGVTSLPAWMCRPLGAACGRIEHNGKPGAFTHADGRN